MISHNEMNDLFGYFLPWSEDICRLVVNENTGFISRDERSITDRSIASLNQINDFGEMSALFEIKQVPERNTVSRHRIVYNDDSGDTEVGDSFIQAYLMAISHVSAKIENKVVADSVAAYFDTLMTEFQRLAAEIGKEPEFFYRGTPFKVIYEFSFGAKLIMPFFTFGNKNSDATPRIVGPEHNRYTSTILAGSGCTVREKWIIIDQPILNEPTPVDMTCDGIFDKMIKSSLTQAGVSGHAALDATHKTRDLVNSLKGKNDFQIIYETKKCPVQARQK